MVCISKSSCVPPFHVAGIRCATGAVGSTDLAAILQPAAARGLCWSTSQARDGLSLQQAGEQSLMRGIVSLCCSSSRLGIEWSSRLPYPLQCHARLNMQVHAFDIQESHSCTWWNYSLQLMPSGPRKGLKFSTPRSLKLCTLASCKLHASHALGRCAHGQGALGTDSGCCPCHS